MRKNRLLALLLTLLLALALCACGGTADAPAEAEEAAEAAETAEPAEAEEPAETEAAEGASKLAAVYDSMDPAAGIHMNYDVDLASMDATTRYDVHSQGGTYYARQSLLKDGYADYDTVKFIQDGQYMSLHIKDQTGVSMKGPSTDTAIITDTIYSAVKLCHDREDFESGQAEVDGTTYDTETFPVTAASPMEQIFCFDENGDLAVLIIAASEEYGTPEMKYTINLIDDQVDTSLFDISSYDITEQ